MLAIKLSDYFFIGMFAFVFLFFAVKIIISDNGNTNDETETETEADVTPEFLARDAVAVKKTYSFRHGTKSYNFKTNFFITFELEDGSTVEYPVGEDIFQRTEESQRGTLVTVNGNFFDFGDGEDIDSENSEL